MTIKLQPGELICSSELNNLFQENKNNRFIVQYEQNDGKFYPILQIVEDDQGFRITKKGQIKVGKKNTFLLSQIGIEFSVILRSNDLYELLPIKQATSEELDTFKLPDLTLEILDDTNYNIEYLPFKL